LVDIHHQIAPTEKRAPMVAPPLIDPRLAELLIDRSNESIDYVLSLAREFLGMDSAYVAEFTDGKQVYRALAGDAASFGQTLGDGPALEGTYCTRMTKGELPSLINDARSDIHTRELSMTKSAGIGAYVGVPVRLAGGKLYGTMCCLSHNAHPSLQERDIQFMHLLARIIGEHIEHERTRVEVMQMQVDHSASLELKVKERTSDLWQAVRHLENSKEQLRRSQEETVQRLARAAEFRDDETGQHIQRMSRYCGLLMEKAGFDRGHADLVRVASQMHDVGKIGTPDNILLKPGRLTSDERALMERHAQIGHDILSESTSDLLQMAATIAVTHHERMDGKGYPRGLAGDEIPIEGRVAAIADVFDALTTDRVYRSAFPLTTALEFMRDGRGAHFDPRLLDLFLDAIPEVLETKKRFDEEGREPSHEVVA
jgi:response regulator RpfG family c-di-GMP phosphodiesterase